MGEAHLRRSQSHPRLHRNPILLCDVQDLRQYPLLRTEDGGMPLLAVPERSDLRTDGRILQQPDDLPWHNLRFLQGVLRASEPRQACNRVPVLVEQVLD